MVGKPEVGSKPLPFDTAMGFPEKSFWFVELVYAEIPETAISLSGSHKQLEP
jgi:hypothetical protein